MGDFVLPTTRYALSGDVNIAYQTMGDGPIDIVMVPGIMSHVEFLHELPGYTAFLRRLSMFARVVVFDKRGQGLLPTPIDCTHASNISASSIRTGSEFRKNPMLSTGSALPSQSRALRTVQDQPSKDANGFARSGLPAAA
jgi:hypothetical protein